MWEIEGEGEVRGEGRPEVRGADASVAATVLATLTLYCCTLAPLTPQVWPASLILEPRRQCTVLLSVSEPDVLHSPAAAAAAAPGAWARAPGAAALPPTPSQLQACVVFAAQELGRLGAGPGWGGALLAASPVLLVQYTPCDLIHDILHLPGRLAA